MHHGLCTSMHVHAVNNLPWPHGQLQLDAMMHHNYVTAVHTFTILLVSSVFTNCHGFYLFISCMTSAALSHQSFHPQLPLYSTQYLWAQWPHTIKSPALNVSLLNCASSMCHNCKSLWLWTTHHCLMCHYLMIVCVDRQCPNYVHPQFTRLAATACLWVTMTTDHMSHLTWPCMLIYHTALVNMCQAIQAWPDNHNHNNHVSSSICYLGRHQEKKTRLNNLHHVT